MTFLFKFTSRFVPLPVPLLFFSFRRFFTVRFNSKHDVSAPVLQCAHGLLLVYQDTGCGSRSWLEFTILSAPLTPDFRLLFNHESVSEENFLSLDWDFSCLTLTWVSSLCTTCLYWLRPEGSCLLHELLNLHWGLIEYLLKPRMVLI